MDIFYDLPDLNRIFPAIRLSVSARFVFISASTVSSNVLLNFFILLPHRDIVNYFFRLTFFRSSHSIANFCILTTVVFFVSCSLPAILPLPVSPVPEPR